MGFPIDSGIGGGYEILFFHQLGSFVCVYLTYSYAALLPKRVGQVLDPQRAMVRLRRAILLDGPGAQAESGTRRGWSEVAR